MSNNCEHKYTLLSDDRRVEKERYSTTYRRTLEFFCEKCLDSKKKEEVEFSDSYKRSDWTYNL